MTTINTIELIWNHNIFNHVNEMLVEISIIDIPLNIAALFEQHVLSTSRLIEILRHHLIFDITSQNLLKKCNDYYDVC
jgi:hypothetical protein